jgi:general secretion pathway protein C
MRARIIAFVIWALVAATGMFWLLRLVASSPSAPAHTVAVATAPAPRGDLTRVLGAAPLPKSDSALAPEPALAARFKLLGVAAPRRGGDQEGLALIAVDGKPARGYKVGAAVDGDLTLLSVHPRGAAIGARGGQPQVRLELPALPPPATGRPTPPALPGAGIAPAGAVVAPTLSGMAAPPAVNSGTPELPPDAPPPLASPAPAR